MNNDPCVNFDITIRVAPSQNEYPPFLLSASYKTRVADGLFRLCSSEPYWEEALDVLADPNAIPRMTLLVDMGSRLFQEVMQGAVRDLWITAMTDWKMEGVHAYGFDSLSIQQQSPALGMFLRSRAKQGFCCRWRNIVGPD